MYCAIRTIAECNVVYYTTAIVTIAVLTTLHQPQGGWLVCCRALLGSHVHLRSSSLLALTKLMAIDPAFCDANLALVFTLLEKRLVHYQLPVSTRLLHLLCVISSGVFCRPKQLTTLCILLSRTCMWPWLEHTHAPPDIMLV